STFLRGAAKISESDARTAGAVCRKSLQQGVCMRQRKVLMFPVLVAAVTAALVASSIPGGAAPSGRATLAGSVPAWASSLQLQGQDAPLARLPSLRPELDRRRHQRRRRSR